MITNYLKKIMLITTISIGLNLIAQDFEWAKSMGGTSYFDFGESITTDAAGNIYTTGSFRSTVDFDPGPGTFNLSSSGEEDLFISKLNANGDFVWAKKIGGSSYERSNSIALDKNGNIFITGSFQEATVDFDPGSGTFNLTSSFDGHGFILKLNSDGDFVWAKAIERAFGKSVTTDATGNVYTTGRFNGTVDFDPGSGTANLSAGSSGYLDAFILKLNASGNYVWAKRIGGSDNDEGLSINIDSLGNVLTTGSFQSEVDFNPGPGIFNITSISVYEDAYILKLDGNGNFLWAKTFGGNTFDEGLSIVTDAIGNVYTTGFFNETVDFNPGSGVFNLTSAGSNDVFVSKLAPSGAHIWTKSFGGTSADYGNSIAIDGSYNVYITGSFEGTVDFDPGVGSTTLNSAGQTDIYIQKLDANGDFVWVQSIGGSSYDEGNALRINSSGEIFITGAYSGTVDFDFGPDIFNLASQGNTDIFVTKLSQCINNIGTDTQVAPSPFTWIDGNTYTSDNNTASFTLMNVGGCDSVVTLNLTIGNNTGLSENIATSSFSVFPNPTNGQLIIKNSQIAFKVELLNILGSSVYSNNINQNELMIDLTKNELSKGTYLIKLTTERNTYFSKIVYR